MEFPVKTVMPSSLRSFGFSIVMVCFGLAGCATYSPSPAPEHEPPPVARPAPSMPEQPVRAVDRLLQDSRSQLAARDWQAAIASAERGLRIDRREAELYLLLAQAYHGLGDLDRSVQFARQGLRHVTSERSAVARALNDLAAAEIH
jgi:Tfp pilus assembly protein PilF